MHVVEGKRICAACVIPEIYVYIYSLRMSTSQVLQYLYSLDTSSPNLLRYLYYLIQTDDEEQYLSSLKGPELTRLVDFLDGVRPSLSASPQLINTDPAGP